MEEVPIIGFLRHAEAAVGNYKSCPHRRALPPLPQGTAHILATHLVADAHHGLVLLLHRQSKQLLVAQRERFVNVSINRQVPATTVDRRVREEVFGDHVILVVRGNLRREKPCGMNFAIVRHWRHDLTFIILDQFSYRSGGTAHALSNKPPCSKAQQPDTSAEVDNYESMYLGQRRRSAYAPVSRSRMGCASPR